MEALDMLDRLLASVPPRLRQISHSARKPVPNKWSAKQELGHLLDSAANNHQRIVRVQLEDGLALPGYPQETWVNLHAYQQREWLDLIRLWAALNEQLLAAARSVPDAAWAHTCTVAGSGPLTLRFVLEDYVEHMLHHLRHVGVEVEDLMAPSTN